MPTYPLTAVVLRKTKLGETDLILTMLGADGALYRAVAKGARKPGSKFGGRGEPATVLDLLIAKGRTLDVISDARIRCSHAVLREDYDLVHTTSALLDFAATVSQEGLDEPDLYDLTGKALDALESCTGNPARGERYLLAYLIKAAALCGFHSGLDPTAADFATVHRFLNENIPARLKGFEYYATMRP
ncbi:MAG: DNA repair protein RecO [Coriobacteriia bacterium]|nr:DNA repair protein RecO [Coriobacteriia bacterium]